MKKFKKIVTALTVLTLSVMVSTAAFAADDSIKLNLNGKAVTFTADNKPIIIDGSTMFQLKAMFDLLNTDDSYTLDWEEDSKMATFKNAETEVKIWTGNGEAEVNGKKVKINGTIPTIVEDRLYVPFRFIMESFGLTVNWNGANKTIGAMDAETLDKVAGLMTGYSEQTDEKSKVYMEFSMDMDMTVEAEDVAGGISVAMGGVIEQDMANKYQHMKVDMSMDMGALGKVEQKTEMYDDGVNSYTSTDGVEFVKGASTLALMDEDFIEKLKSQLDFNAAADLEKDSYAGMLIKNDVAGNYVLDGSIIIPDDMFQKLMGAVSDGMGMGDVMSGVTVSIPEPIYFMYVINKDTGALMSMKMDYKANITMDVEGVKTTTVVTYKVSIPKVDMNATFTSAVPESVTSGAVSGAVPTEATDTVTVPSAE